LDIHRLQSGWIDDACGAQAVVPLPPLNGASRRWSLTTIGDQMVFARVPQHVLNCADLAG